MSYIYGAPILDVSRSHITTQHSRYDSSGRVISSSQRPLPDNTRHSQQTNIHATGGIRTHDINRRAAAGRSPAYIVGSNPTGGMDICLLWVSCVVRQRSLRRADHSSRGVIPTLLRRCVWSRNIKNGCSIYIYDTGRLRVKKKNIHTQLICYFETLETIYPATRRHMSKD